MTTRSLSGAASPTALANPARVRRAASRRADDPNSPTRVEPPILVAPHGSPSPLDMPLLWEGDQG